MHVPLQLNRRKVLPVIRGVEAAECGLACLAMIAQYHGHKIDLNALRQRFPISMSGASLKGLMKLADQLSFSSRAVKAELEAISKLTLPAIIHWDLNHFVVLKSVDRRRLVIHDPSHGARTLTWESFSQHFTGVALELAPASGFTPLHDQQSMRLGDLWKQVSGIAPPSHNSCSFH